MSRLARLVLLPAAASACFDSAPPSSPPPCAVDAGLKKTSLGAFLYDLTPPVSGIAPTDTSAMTNYAAMVGGKPAIVMWYEKWFVAGVPTVFPAADAERVVQLGATPMITWEACDPANAGGKCQNSAPSIYTDRNVVAGMFDPYVTAWAQAAKAWGKPFFFRPNHEMNGTFYPWATAPGNGNTNAPADYVAAWRHLHGVFDAVGVTNAVWVWSPNVGLSPLSEDYPGDAWVDWVALDGYNWGTINGNTWTSFKDVFAASYAELVTLTSKPLMFAETACAPGPGDKAAWIEQGFLCDLPAFFPRVRAVVWFDDDNTGETDWRVNSSSASLQAWKSVVRDGYYSAGPPLR